MFFYWWWSTADQPPLNSITQVESIKKFNKGQARLMKRYVLISKLSHKPIIQEWIQLEIEQHDGIRTWDEEAHSKEKAVQMSRQLRTYEEVQKFIVKANGFAPRLSDRVVFTSSCEYICGCCSTFLKLFVLVVEFQIRIVLITAFVWVASTPRINCSGKVLRSKINQKPLFVCQNDWISRQ